MKTPKTPAPREQARRSQRVGRAGEDAAAAYLEKRGWAVVARNWRSREGEIDIVAREGETWVFVEVRTRTTEEAAFESLVGRKAARMARTALAYLDAHGLAEAAWRVDAIAVVRTRGTLALEHAEHVLDW